MSTLTPQQEVEAREVQARALADAITHAAAADILTIARLLVGKPTHQLFGQTELQLRDLVHNIGVKALDLCLAEKKTAT